MTQENSLSLHRVYIDNKEILASSSGSINFSGNNNLNSMDIVFENIDLQNDSFLNKKVELFLEESGHDSMPIFRGFVKDYTPDETKVRLKVLDVRNVLTGNSGIKINSTDDKNFDGKTLGQFIFEVVTDKVNYDNTVIGLDMLRDTDPVVNMDGLRGTNLDVYKVMVDKIKESFDLTDFSKPLSSFIDVREDSENSNIVITKDKVITDVPSYTFSFGDGIQNLKYKRRKPANTIYYQNNRVLKFNNRPTGQVTTAVNELQDVVETRNLALQQLLLEQQQLNEIDIDVSKCYDIGLGSLIYLDVEDDDVRGTHRVQSKKLTFGKNIKCTLKLNKKPIKLSDYIQ